MLSAMLRLRKPRRKVWVKKKVKRKLRYKWLNGKEQETNKHAKQKEKKKETAKHQDIKEEKTEIVEKTNNAEIEKSKTNNDKNKTEEETALAIEKKLDAKKELPEEVKLKIFKRTTKNLGICLVLMALICTFHLGYLNIARAEFIVDLKFFAFVVLIVSIILFEKAYKKDSGELCIYGIEMLVFATFILFLPYIYFSSTPIVLLIFVLSPLYIGIYYCIKSVIIESRIKKEYYKTLSDVKEITKKERKK